MQNSGKSLQGDNYTYGVSSLLDTVTHQPVDCDREAMWGEIKIAFPKVSFAFVKETTGEFSLLNN